VNEFLTRRGVIGGLGAGLVGAVMPRGLFAQMGEGAAATQRVPVGVRKFRSVAVEAYIEETVGRIGDKELAGLFANCYPNTLDTTVEPGTFEGKPDTAVLTGDIAAMWLRDSSAQVWPYLPLARRSGSCSKG